MDPYILAPHQSDATIIYQKIREFECAFGAIQKWARERAKIEQQMQNQIRAQEDLITALSQTTQTTTDNLIQQIIKLKSRVEILFNTNAELRQKLAEQEATNNFLGQRISITQRASKNAAGEFYSIARTLEDRIHALESHHLPQDKKLPHDA